MTAVVLVGMSIADVNEQHALRRQAAESGATLAFLQHGEPSLTTELTRLAAAGETTIRLEMVALTGRSPARSWMRRVAGHWLREASHRPTILIGDTEVAGTEAGMTTGRRGGRRRGVPVAGAVAVAVVLALSGCTGAEEDAAPTVERASAAPSQEDETQDQDSGQGSGSGSGSGAGVEDADLEDVLVEQTVA